jgi:hypothetical protein
MALLHAIIYDTLLLSCFLTGCMFIRKNWLLQYKLLVILSGLTVLIEMAEQITSHLHFHSKWIYNFFLPLECAFFLYIFYRASVHAAVKRLNATLLMLLPVGAGILYFFFPYFSESNKQVALFYLFSELICACSYVIDLLLIQANTPFARQPLFWVAFGLLIFSGLYVLMITILYSISIIQIFSTYAYVNSLVSNFFLYSGFIICFIRLHKAKPMQNPG